MAPTSSPANSSEKRRQIATQSANGGDSSLLKVNRIDEKRIKKLRAAGILNADSLVFRPRIEPQVPQSDSNWRQKVTKRERKRRQRLMLVSKGVARPETWKGEAIYRRAMGFDGSDDYYEFKDDIDQVIEIKSSWVLMDVIEKTDWLKSETGGEDVAYTYETIIGPSLVLPYRPKRG